MKSIVCLGLSVCVTMGMFAEESTPQNFYYCGKSLLGIYNLTAPGACCTTTDASYTQVTWQDGNWLYLLYNGVSEWPDALKEVVNGDDNSYLTINENASLYGLYYRSGQRYMNGEGKLTLGAGGYQAPNAWDVHQIEY